MSSSRGGRGLFCGRLVKRYGKTRRCGTRFVLERAGAGVACLSCGQKKATTRHFEAIVERERDEALWEARREGRPVAGRLSMARPFPNDLASPERPS